MWEQRTESSVRGIWPHERPFKEVPEAAAAGQAQCCRRRVERAGWSRGAVSMRGSGRLPPSLATAADSTTAGVMKLGEGRQNQRTVSIAGQPDRRRLGRGSGRQLSSGGGLAKLRLKNAEKAATGRRDCTVDSQSTAVHAKYHVIGIHLWQRSGFANVPIKS
jgi:hypothetical protein